MTSTYSTNLKFEEPAAGDYPSSWAAVANTQYTLIDSAIAGITSVTVAASDVTLTSNNGAADQARQNTLVIKGSPAAMFSILIPNNITKHYDVRSKITTDNVVIVNNAAKTGAGVTIAPSESFSMFSDGIRCFKLGVVPKGSIMMWEGSSGSPPGGWRYASDLINKFPKFTSSATTSIAATAATTSIGNPASGTTASHTLTTAEMPSHLHSIGFATVATVQSGSGSTFGVGFSGTTNTGLEGGGGGHTHDIGNHTHPIGVTGGDPTATGLVPIRKYT